MHELQDHDIIRLVLQGQQKPFAILVARYQHYVFTLTLRFIDSKEDAEEVAQDVFIKAYRSLNDYNGTSKFSTWLYTITRNTCISHIRKGKAPMVNIDADILPGLSEKLGHKDEFFNVAEHRSRKDILQRAIQMLPSVEAQVLTLFYLQEQTIDEISTIMQLTGSNVKVRLFRARKNLKTIIDTHFKNELTELSNNG